MSAPSDDAVKARITRHMNADHSDSIADYAAFYCRLPANLARTAALTDLSLHRLTLTVTSPHGAQSEVYIPLNPPMKSYSESRERMVAMANEAMEGLGRSRHKVTRWVAPGLVGGIVSVAVCFGYWAFWFGEREFAPGGFVRE